MSLTSNVLFSPMNRFGFHVDVLKKYSTNFKDRNVTECYIPTRTEVFKLPIDDLVIIIENWFQNAPEELHPSEKQKSDVLELMAKRKDSEKIKAIIDRLSAIAV